MFKGKTNCIFYSTYAALSFSIPCGRRLTLPSSPLFSVPGVFGVLQIVTSSGVYLLSLRGGVLYGPFLVVFLIGCFTGESNAPSNWGIRGSGAISDMVFSLKVCDIIIKFLHIHQKIILHNSSTCSSTYFIIF